MFFHKHPYKPFIQKDTKKLIVGTLPPPRFSTGQLLEKDVNFCYGSFYNSLWLKIDKIHNLNLRYDNSQEAIDQRKQFLIDNKIGICDIVESAERKKVDASDIGMQNIKLRDVVDCLKQYPSIEMILFTGGKSKNGPEYFFRKHLKDYNLKLELVNNEVPRIHKFSLCHPQLVSGSHRTIKTVSLTSGSGAANISISQMPLYKQLRAQSLSIGKNFNTFDFRVMQYSEFL